MGSKWRSTVQDEWVQRAMTSWKCLAWELLEVEKRDEGGKIRMNPKKECSGNQKNQGGWPPGTEANKNIPERMRLTVPKAAKKEKIPGKGILQGRT